MLLHTELPKDFIHGGQSSALDLTASWIYSFSAGSSACAEELKQSYSLASHRAKEISNTKT